jgi:hypothetical protein
MIPKSTMVKANMATEHQTYAVKSGGGYVIGVRTDTPDVPFGSSFQTLVQFKLLPAQNKKQTTMVSPLLRLRLCGMCIRLFTPSHTLVPYFATSLILVDDHSERRFFVANMDEGRNLKRCQERHALDVRHLP